jgi:hypothetical protein
MMPDSDGTWLALPTETEIYILPSGEIVVADLPVELAAFLDHPLLTDCKDQLPSDPPLNSAHVADQQHPTQPH